MSSKRRVPKGFLDLGFEYPTEEVSGVSRQKRISCQEAIEEFSLGSKDPAVLAHMNEHPRCRMLSLEAQDLIPL